MQHITEPTLRETAMALGNALNAAEAQLGLPLGGGKLPLPERLEQILRFAQRYELDEHLYKLAWSLKTAIKSKEASND